MYVYTICRYFSAMAIAIYCSKLREAYFEKKMKDIYYYGDFLEIKLLISVHHRVFIFSKEKGKRSNKP